MQISQTRIVVGFLKLFLFVNLMFATATGIMTPKRYSDFEKCVRGCFEQAAASESQHNTGNSTKSQYATKNPIIFPTQTYKIDERLMKRDEDVIAEKNEWNYMPTNFNFVISRNVQTFQLKFKDDTYINVKVEEPTIDLDMDIGSSWTNIFNKFE